ncbi:hypothetical protein [Enterococcus villorum]|uniref:hypothetical protein n=1 Tax=Enterococcus villorum TaxID=112904 RepID=UPI0015C44D91|nr:hypothetical protein [Enterococcus villorum]
MKYFKRINILLIFIWINMVYIIPTEVSVTNEAGITFVESDEESYKERKSEYMREIAS